MIIGIGLNIVSNPSIESRNKTTNILFETKNKPSLIEMINLLISSYEKFFSHLNSYNFSDFKKKANLMALD